MLSIADVTAKSDAITNGNASLPLDVTVAFYIAGLEAGAFLTFVLMPLESIWMCFDEASNVANG